MVFDLHTRFYQRTVPISLVSGGGENRSTDHQVLVMVERRIMW
jgi:hypothetical protein